MPIIHSFAKTIKLQLGNASFPAFEKFYPIRRIRLIWRLLTATYSGRWSTLCARKNSRIKMISEISWIYISAPTQLPFTAMGSASYRIDGRRSYLTMEITSVVKDC
jgi:hypothetical protein